MPKQDVRVAIMVSGGGSNMEAILQAAKEGKLPGLRIVLVISSNPNALALGRAKNYGIETAVIERQALGSEDAVEAAILDRLAKSKVDVICLAGYMRMLNAKVVRQYASRILNIHPALLPKFGGPGMYGHFVHEAVLAAKEKESGCSVHIVDEQFDHGPVLAQQRVPVLSGDTAETLAVRVLEAEHALYPKTLREFCEKLKEGHND